MGENSKIEWTDHTFNPWIGCTKVSPACNNCYAAGQDNRRKWTPEGWGAGKPRHRTSEATWNNPLKWNRQAEADGIRRRVFCASLADVFDSEVDPLWRENLFAIIDLTPWLDWLLLTKRPKLAAEYFCIGDVPPNVWMGTTVENQKMADQRIPHLWSVQADVRFLSMEPLLEPVVLPKYMPPDWVIVGGESGPGARHMDANWARDLRDQSANMSAAFFFKQMTKKAAIPQDLMIRQFPDLSGDGGGSDDN